MFSSPSNSLSCAKIYTLLLYDLILWLNLSSALCLCLCAENKGPRKVFLPNKLLECLPRLSGLPNERLRWNTNEVRTRQSCLCAAFTVRMAAGAVVHVTPSG